MIEKVKQYSHAIIMAIGLLSGIIGTHYIKEVQTAEQIAVTICHEVEEAWQPVNDLSLGEPGNG